MPDLISGLSEIIDSYDYFIIDIWGVLHDGTLAYRASKDALSFLNDNKKNILLLSNAPRSSSFTRANLERLGFHKDLYKHVLTSGDLLGVFFSERKIGSSYFHIGKKMDEAIISNFGYDLVSDYKKADFIVCTGYEDIDLSALLNLGLKLYCANPDLVVVRQDGTREYCAGFVAKNYLELGGEVEFFGKPGLYAYKKSMEMLGVESKDKILCIGDSCHTDITGANNAGLDSVFIAGGLHNIDSGNKLHLDRVFAEHGCSPTYVMQLFSK
jgi:HAD superfamily hydrolase (TIGR01459 family)